jgi:hypothetical protein
MAQSSQPLTAPFNVVGAQLAPLNPPKLPRLTLQVFRSDLNGSGPPAAWFGGAPRRTLVLGVRNGGSLPVTNPPLELTEGKGSNPSDFVSAPDLGTLAPGEGRTYSIPISFQPFSVGSYSVQGVLGPIGQSTAFIPWGLVGVAVVLAGLILLWIRNRVRSFLRWRRRRRVARRAPEGAVSAGEVPPRFDQELDTDPKQWLSQE